MSVLPYAKSGLIGASILGLGRAVGETMAVTMLMWKCSWTKGISVWIFSTGKFTCKYYCKRIQ